MPPRCPAHEVGLAILGPLRALDPVAYLRFASVYKAFSSADDFEDEIALLRMEQDASTPSVEPVETTPSDHTPYRPDDPQTTRRVVGKLRAGCTTSTAQSLDTAVSTTTRQRTTRITRRCDEPRR